MNLDIYSTGTLLGAFEEMDHSPSFLRDTFFPTDDSNVFSQEQVFIDWRDDDRRLAPFITDHATGVLMGRRDFRTTVLTPPKIAPERVITLDVLKKRGFGEALYGSMTPSERAAQLAVDDMRDLDRFITRREEWMAAQTLINNGCSMVAYAGDGVEGQPIDIEFFDPQKGNEAVYTVTTPWDQAGADIIGDLYAMADDLTSRGKRADTFLCSTDVARAITKDEEIRELLDNRRFEMGEIAPRMEDYPTVAVYGQLIAGGHVITIITYNETYQDDDGEIKPYIPEGTGIMLSSGCGSTLYGAIDQIDDGARDFRTYTGRRIPKYDVNAKASIRTLALQSRPVCVPKGRNPWLTATGLVA